MCQGTVRIINVKAETTVRKGFVEMRAPLGGGPRWSLSVRQGSNRRACGRERESYHLLCESVSARIVFSLISLPYQRLCQNTLS